MTTDAKDLQERLEPFVHGLGRAIAREVFDTLEAVQAACTKYRNEYSTSHAALQFVKAEREALQAENEKLIAALDACRDAFPVPEPYTTLDGYYTSAMAEPLAVPDYVGMCVAGASPRPDDCANTPYDEGPFTIEQPNPTRDVMGG